MILQHTFIYMYKQKYIWICKYTFLFFFSFASKWHLNYMVCYSNNCANIRTNAHNKHSYPVYTYICICTNVLQQRLSSLAGGWKCVKERVYVCTLKVISRILHAEIIVSSPTYVRVLWPLRNASYSLHISPSLSLELWPNIPCNVCYGLIVVVYVSQLV